MVALSTEQNQPFLFYLRIKYPFLQTPANAQLAAVAQLVVRRYPRFDLIQIRQHDVAVDLVQPTT
jgi:hypothetical protein